MTGLKISMYINISFNTVNTLSCLAKLTIAEERGFYI